MAHFRISNSLEHLRAEERGGADAYASNPDLLVLRKLIEEEMEHVSPDGGLQAPWSPPPLGVGSGFFTARPPPGQLSVGRWAAPGHWAAEARSHAFHAHEQVLRCGDCAARARALRAHACGVAPGRECAACGSALTALRFRSACPPPKRPRRSRCLTPPPPPPRTKDAHTRQGVPRRQRLSSASSTPPR